MPTTTYEDFKLQQLESITTKRIYGHLIAWWNTECPAVANTFSLGAGKAIFYNKILNQMNKLKGQPMNDRRMFLYIFFVLTFFGVMNFLAVLNSPAWANIRGGDILRTVSIGFNFGGAFVSLVAYFRGRRSSWRIGISRNCSHNQPDTLVCKEAVFGSWCDLLDLWISYHINRKIRIIKW